MMENPFLYLYFSPLLLIWVVYVYWRRRSEQRAIAERDEAETAGLTEPMSLHPVIDPSRCIGSGGCIAACPEGNVLGMIGGKAAVINPSHCIGHGACKSACHMDAISLVFGTERRGVDIPEVAPNFETNIPGIFIAGELGGMGLIRNAIEQGRQALEAICKLKGIGQGERLDLVIVGAGPAGFSASLGAMQQKLRFVTLEQDTFGGTVAHFPSGKIVMTAPVKLPLVGKMKFSETTKEALLAFWHDALDKTGLQINDEERLEGITPVDGGFEVVTSKSRYRSRTVLLAIGRRGTPRKLGVEGEKQSKVVYRLIDAEQYRDQHVLIVGGGDSALEAATTIAAEPGTTVTLSYRSGAFSRAKPKNRQNLEDAVANGDLKVIFNSNVKRIGVDVVTLLHEEGEIELPNDAVIVLAGGILPTPFLKRIGINVETKFGSA